MYMELKHLTSVTLISKRDAVSKEAYKLKELLKLRISKIATTLKQKDLLVTGGLMSNYQKKCYIHIMRIVTIEMMAL